jgi:hypothetical protein
MVSENADSVELDQDRDQWLGLCERGSETSCFIILVNCFLRPCSWVLQVDFMSQMSEVRSARLETGRLRKGLDT